MFPRRCLSSLLNCSSVSSSSLLLQLAHVPSPSLLLSSLACPDSKMQQDAVRTSSGSACSTSYAQSSHAFSTAAASSPQPNSSNAAQQPSFRNVGSRPQKGSRATVSKMAQLMEPSYFVGLHNLRDNPGARQQKIRVGRGNSARRGNYCGRGMKGQKARSTKPHTLYDGGTLSLLKFPITRERPPYEVLYNQLGVTRLMDYVKLGLLDHRRVITMKDLYDVGCVPNEIKYGVMLYSQARTQVTIPLHLQVTACTDAARNAIEAAGGTVTRVYYTAEGLKGLLKPQLYTSKRLPLPLPAHSWHPKFNDKFDAIGQLPPVLSLPAPSKAAPGIEP
ncbi:ribosomal protein L18e/L15P [Dunaliella salina]|uniref:Ribosomal protein L18e/L15P n=1 Tax=Dunaliella salina TaxID=3046 RepID=A0ABQ7GGZ4_DUNSA|nr:ribosomal protein L18e/L15P [Dunaliella salina]|eukprot:KAF5833875.1 ribosomal protein L18e/L15P [Dunaliella salina]